MYKTGKIAHEKGDASQFSGEKSHGGRVGASISLAFLTLLQVLGPRYIATTLRQARSYQSPITGEITAVIMTKYVVHTCRGHMVFGSISGFNYY